jgi:hypothetical protein
MTLGLMLFIPITIKMTVKIGITGADAEFV